MLEESEAKSTFVRILPPNYLCVFILAAFQAS